jgi:hypothetical protein
MYNCKNPVRPISEINLQTQSLVAEPEGSTPLIPNSVTRHDSEPVSSISKRGFLTFTIMLSFYLMHLPSESLLPNILEHFPFIYYNILRCFPNFLVYTAKASTFKLTLTAQSGCAVPEQNSNSLASEYKAQ